MNNSIEMGMGSTPEVDTSFEHKNLSVLRQQIFDLTDEIAERTEKLDAKMNLEKEHGDTTGSAIVHGVETTPGLIMALKRRLEKMKEIETLLIQAEHTEKIGTIKSVARKAAMVAGVTLGSFMAKEGIDPRNTTKAKTIADTEVVPKP